MCLKSRTEVTKENAKCGRIRPTRRPQSFSSCYKATLKDNKPLVPTPVLLLAFDFILVISARPRFYPPPTPQSLDSGSEIIRCPTRSLFYFPFFLLFLFFSSLVVQRIDGRQVNSKGGTKKSLLRSLCCVKMAAIGTSLRGPSCSLWRSDATAQKNCRIPLDQLMLDRKLTRKQKVDI